MPQIFAYDIEQFPKVAKMTWKIFLKSKNHDELGGGGVTSRKGDEIIYILRVSGWIF